MNKQPERLISADKVRKWWNDRFDEWGPDTLPSDFFSDLHAGTFDPEPNPTPTIKPGDRVLHRAHGMGTAGTIVSMVYVQFDKHEILMFRMASELKVINNG